ncbi:hypothetical protein AB836_00120 [Rickettsiales bacterium (ex Bugula neritina AB1)]|nr:hypothetical protein AB836_00120 [Rickettsiales bacterium (ex Bugula neritina AB1)]
MTNIMSKELYLKLKNQLFLLEKEISSNIEDISDARSKGDLKENSEYSAAKSKEHILKKEMQRLQQIIKTAKVVDISLKDTVSFGVTVLLEDMDKNESLEYTIVNEEEVNIKEGKIAYTSIIARNIINKKKGDICIFKVPIGEKKYLIKDFYIKE